MKGQSAGTWGTASVFQDEHSRAHAAWHACMDADSGCGRVEQQTQCLGQLSKA